jgi:uncharacterized delta-60 repeat protein
VAVAAVVAVAAGCDYAVGTDSGQLDPDFGGGDGVASFAGTARSDEDAELAVRQPGGRIVVVARRPDNGVALVGYRPDGTFDPDFGDGGVAATSLPFAVLLDAIAAPDGDVVVVGAIFGGPVTGWLVARYLPDGAPDPAFGQNGIARVFPDLEAAVPLGGVDGVAAAGDDLVLRARREGTSGLNDTALVRVGPDGKLVTGFGPDGTGSVRIGDSVAGAIAALPDGSFVSSFSGGGDAGLKYVSATGEVTATVSLAGLASGPSRVDGIEAGADGSVVVGGPAPGADGVALLRVTPAHAVDPDFGTGGVATVPLQVGTTTAIDQVPAGTLLATGTPTVNDLRFEVGLVDATGALVPGYGDGGVATFADGASFKALLGTPSGAVLVGATSPTGDQPGDVLLRAVDAAGAADPDFGDGGVSRPDIGQPGQDEFSVVARLPDRRLLVAGDTGDGLIAGRYAPDGTPDAGHPPAPLLPDLFQGPHAVRDAAVAADGAAFLLVQDGDQLPQPFFGGGGSAWRVIKLRPGGDVDPTWGDGGIVTQTGSSFPHAIGVRPDGSVLVAWTRIEPGHPVPPHGVQPATFEFLVSALTATGAPDTSFGTGGTIRHPASGGESPPGPPHTGWMAIGSHGEAYFTGIGLARLDPAGTAFTPATLPAGLAFPQDVTVDAGGRVLVTGVGSGGASRPDVVARFDADLVPDTSFGTAGVAPLPGIPPVQVTSGPILLVDGLGRITVVAQGPSEGRTYADLVIRKLRADGSVDTAFSGDGVALAAFQPGGRDVTVQGAGLAGRDVVVVGSTATTGHDAVIVQVNG